MSKIRINELARELEVKAHEILDKLPELGVSEKKTHSSSIDDDVALKLRRLFGHEAPLEPYAEEAADLSAAQKPATAAETLPSPEPPDGHLQPSGAPPVPPAAELTGPEAAAE